MREDSLYRAHTELTLYTVVYGLRSEMNRRRVHVLDEWRAFQTTIDRDLRQKNKHFIVSGKRDSTFGWLSFPANIYVSTTYSYDPRRPTRRLGGCARSPRLTEFVIDC